MLRIKIKRLSVCVCVRFVSILFLKKLTHNRRHKMHFKALSYTNGKYVYNEIPNHSNGLFVIAFGGLPLFHPEMRVKHENCLYIGVIRYADKSQTNDFILCFGFYSILIPYFVLLRFIQTHRHSDTLIDCIWQCQLNIYYISLYYYYHFMSHGFFSPSIPLFFGWPFFFCTPENGRQYITIPLFPR